MLLDFPSIQYGGRETPVTLRPLLYKGGVNCRIDTFEKELLKGSLGEEILERLPFVVMLHQELNSSVASGGSKATFLNNILYIKQFYKHSELLAINPTAKNAFQIYCSWINELYQKLESKGGSEEGVYGKATFMASLLGAATGLGREYFIHSSGLTPPRKNSGGIFRTDKQDLQETKRFIGDLTDIIAALGPEAFSQKLPVSISFQDGFSTKSYGALSQFEVDIDEKLLSTTMEVRYPLYNLRSDAERMLFISQTSMNLTDATNLKADDYRFETKNEKCEVRAYKGRKKGEVVFTIYNEYKPFLTEFIRFRKAMGIDKYTDKLFGKIPQPGNDVSSIPHPRSLVNFMAKNDRKVIGAGILRKTRQNWLARVGGDLMIAAELGQHDVITFVKNYSRPHHQTASTEWSSFLKDVRSERRSAIDGVCNGTPKPIALKPQSIDTPDCKNESLCLFCANYKGVKNYSYIWSLLSYKYLRHKEKLIIAIRKGDVSGVDATISRIDEITKAFSLAGNKFLSWENKARNSVSDGEYHPRWSGHIQLVEIMSL